MTHQAFVNLQESLCAALRKPLNENGHLALTAALGNYTPAEIGELLGTLTNAEILAIFNWLDDDRAVSVLNNLNKDQASYVLHNAPPGRVANLPLTDSEPLLPKI